MPIYCYECTKCGNRADEYREMYRRYYPASCSCGGAMRRDPGAELPRSPQEEFTHPIEMQSVAYTHSEDVRAFKERHPDIQCSENPRDPLFGVPVVKNRHEKMAVLRGEGFAERN